MIICVKPLINGHSKRRTPLISGQFHFPRPFPSQILIKKFLKGGHSISGPSDQRTIFLHEMAKTPILALQLADIEYQTGHRRPKSKKFQALISLIIQNSQNYSRLPVIRTCTYSNNSVIRSEMAFPLDLLTQLRQKHSRLFELQLFE